MNKIYKVVKSHYSLKLRANYKKKPALHFE